MSNSKEQYLAKLLTLVHSKGGKFISTVYVDESTAHVFECIKGHRWEDSPRSVKRGAWCEQCGYKPKSKERGRKKFEDAFVSKGGKVVGRYINNDTKVLVECINKHQWNVRPDSVQLNWCSRCSGKSKEQAQENFEEAIISQGYKILGEYVINNEYISALCPQGHIIQLLPSSVTRHGFACYTCDTIMYITKFQEAVEKQKGEILEPYVNMRTKVLIRCIRGHEWKISPGNTIMGRWCSTCNESVLEKEAELCLQQFMLSYKRQFIVPKLPRKRYDFYFEYCGIKFLIEMDGKQHFEYTPYFHESEEDFHSKQNVDILKNLIAHYFGYKLIRIDYTQKDNISYHLIRAIQDPVWIYLSSPDNYNYLSGVIFPDLIIKHSKELASKLQLI